MKESHDEGLASHIDPESCADFARKGGGEALTGARAGGAIEPRNVNPTLWVGLRGADAVSVGGRPHRAPRFRERRQVPARSETPGMHGHILRGSREIPGLSARRPRADRVGKSKDVRR